MTQADSVHSTPPLNTPIPPKGLIQQERQREKALKRIAKLRKRAAAEIERLLAFLDACDPYVTTELEDDNDSGDASYPESCPKALRHQHEDEEDNADFEASLGSSGHAEADAISYLVHAFSDGERMVYDCEGDEHDGREPEESEATLQPLSLNPAVL